MQDVEHMDFANNDPRGFLQAYTDKEGLIIDEAQYAPALFGQIKVFVVEVCQGCSWNHVYSSYVLGDGKARRPLRKPADWLD